MIFHFHSVLNGISISFIYVEREHFIIASRNHSRSGWLVLMNKLERTNVPRRQDESRYSGIYPDPRPLRSRCDAHLQRWKGGLIRWRSLTSTAAPRVPVTSWPTATSPLAKFQKKEKIFEKLNWRNGEISGIWSLDS